MSKVKPRRAFVEQDFVRYHDIYLGQRWEGTITVSKLPPTACYLDISEVCATEQDAESAQLRKWRGRSYYRYWFRTILDGMNAFTERCLPQFEAELRRTVPTLQQQTALQFFRLWVEKDLLRDGRLCCYPRPLRQGTCNAAESAMTNS